MTTEFKINKIWIQRLSIISLVIIIAGGLIFIVKNKNTNEPANSEVVKIENNIQTIDITVKQGYSPRIIEAKAGVPTKIIFTTNNTFDCSAALVIPKLKVDKILPTSGKTEFTVEAQKAGSEIKGACSMGMYDFKIKFV